MADPTTEHETEPVTLDKPGGDVDVESNAADTVVESTSSGDAAPEASAGGKGKSGRRWSRRARRSAGRATDAGAGTEKPADAIPTDASPAAAEGPDADEPVEPDEGVETETPSTSGSEAKTAKGPKVATLSKAGTSKAGTSKAGTSKAGKRSGTAQRSKSEKRPKAGSDAKADTSGSTGRSASRRFGARGLGRVIVALSVVAVLLLVLFVVQLIKGPGNAKKLEAQEDRREDARQAAATELPRLYSFDYRQIDANIAEQLNLTTGTIHDQIQSSTAPALKALAPKTKVVVQAVAVETAVLSDDAQSVQVIVFLNQATTNNLLSAPRLDRNRLVATMQLVNNQWKIADVKAV